MNSHLCDLREYLDHSISNMDAFFSHNHNLITYNEFCNTIQTKSIKLREFRDELLSINPFKAGFSKIVEIGYMLKCFYRLHSNLEYDDALRYSIGFEGYINNMTGISNNIISGNLSFAVFNSAGSNCKFTQQYYPAYLDQKYVKNNCDFTKIL